MAMAPAQFMAGYICLPRSKISTTGMNLTLATLAQSVVILQPCFLLAQSGPSELKS
jgi:hypothetical protein